MLCLLLILAAASAAIMALILLLFARHIYRRWTATVKTPPRAGANVVLVVVLLMRLTPALSHSHPYSYTVALILFARTIHAVYSYIHALHDGNI